MRLKSCLAAMCTALGLLGAACAGDGGDDVSGTASDKGARSFDEPFTDAEAYPVVASSELVEGDNRMLIGLLSDEDAPIASPEISLHVAFYDLAESDSRPAFETDAEFVDTGPRGLYVTYPTFDSAGKWGAEVTVAGDGLDETVRTSFEVLEESSTPAIGERVPASRTPTLGDSPLAEISTDGRPDRRFYERSIHEALRAEEPFVVTFATPKFCSSAVCAPTLDIVKRESEEWPRIEFIHVEVYTNLDEPDDLKPVPAVKQWGLPSEPWVFVVDSRGRLAAKFEGTVAPRELARALKDLR
jgi:hypothetical protein